MGKIYDRIIGFIQYFDFLAPLAFRLYLVPVFWMAGTMKFHDIHAVANWFAAAPPNGLGFHLPTFLAYLATYAELVGALFLLIGFFMRFTAIVLMIVMAVAAIAVHWVHGWPAIAPAGSQASIMLQNIVSWLKTASPEHYADLFKYGRPVMLNNGIEFAATYFIMLLSLFFTGAGKYFSVDYWVWRKKSL
jgi:putative oxidoreductase